ncbi:MAG: Gfo/Idh/MocA family oxidoreductase [Clostridiales bacterium]|nr:Gfo/Idh/MocA family oxidoreductase [Clostridiales bacterium]
MNTKIKIALIGCGKRGHLHTAAILHEPRYELCAICDIKPDAMEALADRFKLSDEVKRYTSYEQMLDEIRPEMVVQALWPEHRLPVYKSCIKYGVKHMVSEKPMAPTWDDAVEMRRLAETSGCRLSFTHQRRFSPGNRKVRELVKAGAIGEIERIDMFAFQHLLDCGTHSLDQAWSYIGDIPISWVMGSLELKNSVSWFDTPGEGTFAGTLQYSNGILGSIFLGLPNIASVRPDENGVTLYGTKGYMELDWEGKLYGHFSADMMAELDEFAAMTPSDCLGHYPDDNIAMMWKNLADCYLNGTEDETNWRNAYNAVEVIFALYESVRRCGRVELPLTGVKGNPLIDIINLQKDE